MITYSIIKKSQLEGAHRLDAEYYQPEYLELEKKLSEVPCKFLKDVTTRISRGKQPTYIENGNIFAFTSDQIRDDFIDIASARYTDEAFYINNSKAQAKLLDVLLNSTGVGTLGRVNFYYLNKKAMIDGHITIIRTIQDKLDPIFLSVFLKTRFGQYQINRYYSGSSGQIELHPDQIKEFKIFTPDTKTQNEIANLVENGIELEQMSENFYSQAEELLLEELGLKDFKIEEDLYYSVNLSDIKIAHRADAEYFQPKYERMKEKIKNNNIKSFGDLVSMKKGFEPGSESYQDEGKIFIRVSSISKHGLVEKDQKYINEELYLKLKKDFEPKIGEVLLTKDATPGIAYTIKESIEGIISSGILRLSLKEGIEPEYLSLCINSVIGKMQVKQDSGGSIIEHWKPDQIKKLQIPILPQETQQKIATLVQQSHEARKKAKGLLEEAKQRVENLIEASK